jgi:large subunit ribosomal protein L30e
MDFNASLRRAIKTGNVILGQNNTEKCMKEGKAQMIVIAGNCPASFKSKLSGYENLFIHTFEGSSVALGKACGKPFMVSTLAIVTPGESDILSLKRA